MKLHFLSGGRLEIRKSIYFVDADRDEMLELPVACGLVRHAQGNLLFDTGCHPSVAENAEARWGGLTKFMRPTMDANDNVLVSLDALDLAPTDIDCVVCSHLHPDHCGCNEYFTNATILVSREELTAARAPDAIKHGYYAADFEHPIPIDEVDGERDVFGDGKVVLKPLPGHTPGSIGAMVALDKSGLMFLTSDAVSIRQNLDDDAPPRNTWNRDAAFKTFAEVRHVERGGATIICGHDIAQWNSLKKGAEFYD